MNAYDLTPPQLRRLLPRNYVLVDDLPSKGEVRRRDIKAPLIKITKTRLTIGERAYRALGSPAEVAAAMSDYDLILFKGRGWKVQRKNRSRWIQPWRIKDVLECGEYDYVVNSDIKPIEAIIIRGALAVPSTSFQVVTAARYEHVLAEG